MLISQRQGLFLTCIPLSQLQHPLVITHQLLNRVTKFRNVGLIRKKSNMMVNRHPFFPSVQRNKRTSNIAMVNLLQSHPTAFSLVPRKKWRRRIHKMILHPPCYTTCQLYLPRKMGFASRRPKRVGRPTTRVQLGHRSTSGPHR